MEDFGFDVGKTHVSLWGLLVVIVVLVGVILSAQLGSRIARRTFAHISSLDPAQQLLGEKIVSIAVWILAILVGIDILNIDLTALKIFSGAFGLAIGFGLQKTFGNLISGIILLMDRSIKPGDVIAINGGANGTVGQVRKIGIRAVSVATLDNVEYLIPNENLMTSQVENWSYSTRDVRTRVAVGVAYGTDLDLAEELMLEAARSCERVLASPGPAVLLTDFGASSINFSISVSVGDPEGGLGRVKSDVLKAIWRAFVANGIEIPFPQSDVRIRQLPESAQVIAPAGQMTTPDHGPAPATPLPAANPADRSA